MKFIFTLLCSIVIINTFATNNLWQSIGDKNLQLQGERKIMPQYANVVKLDDAAFRSLQLSIPAEASGQSIVLTLPAPDGTFKTFKVFERTCMDQQLADKYPMIKTYQAICVENPSIIAKLDYTPFGFHAMVFDNAKTYFIDPYTNVNTGYYNCYYKKGYTRPNYVPSVCATQGKPTIITDDDNSANRVTPSNNGAGNITSPGLKRTFRLALACTIEYSAAVGGPTPTKATVLAAMVTSLNRINGVYEKELSIHMNLVPNNDTLIFITSDSYVNNDGGTMLGQNQIICNNRIGNANYDIGHVFSTGGGGVAYLGVVCNNADKARGVTGLTNPVGDAYDIDYVAHEMGHQFGGNHTFNAATGSCSGNREATVAYEPGSGTTIMAYAGICNNNNPQLHSDDYFHRASLDEIYSYISTTSCAVTANNGNTPPTVSNYADSFFVPYKTSFEIAASATDAGGRPLNYCWEQWDLGPQGNWNAANNNRAPIFRSFLPNASGTRVFPTYDSLINNSIKYLGEVLPEVARDVKFRCTVRNINNDGYGAYNAPDVNLKIKSIVTPSLFRVNSFPTLTTITGNTQQTITWDVAGTTASPISCSNVDIYLSIDSARTFPYLLASNTANDGSETITIPDVATVNASARIKVKGSGNVFFDLNNGWIKINQGTSSGVVASFTSNDTTVCEKSTIVFTNISTGSPDSLRWTINGGTTTTSTSTTTVSSTFNTAGTYTVSLVAYKAGVASTPFTKTIIVKALPVIGFSPSTPTTCAGVATSITASYIPGATCIWSNGSQLQTISVSPTANTYYAVTVTNNGCIAKDSVLVSVNPTPVTNITRTLCEGSSITIGGQTLTTDGQYTVVLTSSLGCDSTVNLTLNITAKPVTDISRTICSGEIVTIGSELFSTQGLYTVVLTSSLGCDSTVNLTLTVNPKPTIALNETICAGSSFTVGAQSFTTEGLHTVILTSSEGCDSTINLNLNVTTVPTPGITLVNDSLTVTNSSGIEYKWYLNGVLQATTTSPTYKPTTQGSWTVVVSNNNCESETSAPFVVTALKNNKSDIIFAIVPNPNNGQFELKITSDKAANYQLSLYNVTGQEIRKEEISVLRGVNSKLFNLGNIEKGMYFISLTGKDGVTTQNIIVQ